MEKKNFEEKELEILRKSVDNASSLSGRKIAQSEDIKKIINKDINIRSQIEGDLVSPVFRKVSDFNSFIDKKNG